jgi:hypothetical protein
MVQEILKLSEMFVETPGRKFKGGEVWAMFPNLTSKVALMKEQYEANTKVEEDTQLLLQLFNSLEGKEEDDNKILETYDGNPLETLIEDDIVDDDNDNLGIKDELEPSLGSKMNWNHL